MWKCKVTCLGCAVGQYYMSIENQHVKNEHLLAIKGWNYVADIMCVRGLVGVKKWKFLHFATMFWLLKLNWPTTNLKSMKMLFHFLKVKNMPHKHYLIPWVGRWKKTMHYIVMQSTKVVVEKVTYIVVGWDEVITITTPLWDKCEGEAHTPKSGQLESSGTPKNSELEFRGQNTLHWGGLYAIESSWSVDVQNGLAWAIWTSAAQVMGERRAGS